MPTTLFYLLSICVEANPETKLPYLEAEWRKGISKNGKTIDRFIGSMVEEIDPSFAPFLAQQFGHAVPYEQLAHVLAGNPPATDEKDDEPDERERTEAPRTEPTIVKEITVPASTLKNAKPAPKAKR
jgi:hypothetical protein